MFLTDGNGINDNLQAAVTFLPVVLMVIAVGVIIVESVIML
jgi:hypothetical protein